MDYLIHLLIFFEIYLIVALSLNLLVGYAGLLHIGHAAYFGIGAYTTALLTSQINLSFLPALLCAGTLSAMASLLVSLPSWRLKGDYFLMVSLAVQIALYSLMYNWIAVTKGPYGIPGIPKPDILGVNIDTNTNIMLFYGLLVALMFIVIYRLKKSPFGRSLQAMRDDEVAARIMGVSTNLLKVQVFMFASFLVAIAGGMYAAYVSYIDPTSFNLDESILMLSMVIIGGTGNIKGPIVGAAIVIILPEILRLMMLPDSIAANIQLLAYGLLLIIMMRWRPQGLLGEYRLK